MDSDYKVQLVGSFCKYKESFWKIKLILVTFPELKILHASEE